MPPNKAADGHDKHGVSRAEVEEVLRRPGEDRPVIDDSRVAIGRLYQADT